MRRRYKKKYYVLVMGMMVFIFILHMVVSGRKIEGQIFRKESSLPELQTKAQNKTKKKIRVLITTDRFAHTTHAIVKLRAKGGLKVSAAGKTYQVKGGTIFRCKPDDTRFKSGKITVQPIKKGEKIKVIHLKRAQGKPAYRGKIELYATAEGIVMINELSLEKYLYGVVPSEMPASYHMEALKCQAICARSYAYCQMEKYAYPKYKAHVNDSTSYQVYGNSEEQKRANQAVDETKGMTVQFQGKTVLTYYFSTSCGKTTDMGAWGKKKKKREKYLQSVSVCDENGTNYERKLPWYRWSVSLSKKELANLLELNTGKEIGTVKELRIVKKGSGGIALKINVAGTKGSLILETENDIRKALGNGNYEIQKQDGSVSRGHALLPSAFIDIAYREGYYRINGGGVGHGIGMSQNGANEMAKAGKNYKEILKFFYTGCMVG